MHMTAEPGVVHIYSEQKSEKVQGEDPPATANMGMLKIAKNEREVIYGNPSL